MAIIIYGVVLTTHWLFGRPKRNPVTGYGPNATDMNLIVVASWEGNVLRIHVKNWGATATFEGWIDMGYGFVPNLPKRVAWVGRPGATEARILHGEEEQFDLVRLISHAGIEGRAELDGCVLFGTPNEEAIPRGVLEWLDRDNSYQFAISFRIVPATSTVGGCTSNIRFTRSSSAQPLGGPISRSN